MGLRRNNQGLRSLLVGMARFAGVVVLAGMSFFIALATQVSAARGRCDPAAAHALLRTAEARVYRLGFEIYGCAFATGKRRAIGSTYVPQRSSSGGGGTTHLRLVGHFAATVDVLEDEGGRLAGIYVYDLRNGRTTYHWEVGADGANHSAGDADVTDLALTANGSVGFIEGTDGPAQFKPPGRLIVRRHDARGNAILEDSATVAATSLTLGGHRLRWTSDGRGRSASLR